MLTNEPNIDKLNSFLASEMSAFKTYGQAKERIVDDVIRDQLEGCESSHRQRIQHLKDSIVELGAMPIEADCPVWNSFANLLADNLLGIKDKEAVIALEEEEELGLKLYQMELESADGHVRELMLEKLLPAQEYTHDAISILKFSIS